LAEPIILAIESSCDDTSAAVLRGSTVLSNVVAGQQVHEQYGGVVPELASRAHQKNIVPTVHAALEDANISADELDAIAFTQGPGLMGSLLVGACFAKGYAQSLDIPLVAVNHMEAHIMAHFIGQTPSVPMICLTVSGGHTQIVMVKGPLEFEVLGETMDDAAGEAFDKCAKLIGLPYPGGPHLDRLAQEGDPTRFKFPIGQMANYQFSFSGLKTAVLYFLRKQLKEDPEFIVKNQADLAASIQFTIVETLMIKLKKAVKEKGVKSVALAGGVSANSELRDRLTSWQGEGFSTYIPEFQYCTDNAAMIGCAGYHKFLKGELVGLDVVPLSRLKI
jgi:N6-L-threonylcarbamoyladenine synthase